ncbi:MAG: hypothetical protein RID91_10000 [Azospirillaceae bacterium]
MLRRYRLTAIGIGQDVGYRRATLPASGLSLVDLREELSALIDDQQTLRSMMRAATRPSKWRRWLDRIAAIIGVGGIGLLFVPMKIGAVFASYGSLHVIFSWVQGRRVDDLVVEIDFALDVVESRRNEIEQVLGARGL